MYAICLMLLPRYFYLRNEGSIWWAPIVLEIIVAHCLLAVQMGVEYFTWNEKKQKWLKEFNFRAEFKADKDASENMIRQKLDSMAQLPEVENKEILSGSHPKNLKISANYYSAVFYGLMKENKPKFKLLDENQVDLYKRACFIYGI